MAIETDKSVFISYRRSTSWHLAKMVRDDLVKNEYDVFLDKEGMGPGNIEEIIPTEIHARPNFVLIVGKGSLLNCKEPGDWITKECRIALAAKRNIVPVLDHGFDHNDLKEHLPEELQFLTKLNSIKVNEDHWESCMKRLKSFLKNSEGIELVERTPKQRDAVAEIKQQIERDISQEKLILYEKAPSGEQVNGQDEELSFKGGQSGTPSVERQEQKKGHLQTIGVLLGIVVSLIAIFEFIKPINQKEDGKDPQVEIEAIEEHSASPIPSPDTVADVLKTIPPTPPPEPPAKRFGEVNISIQPSHSVAWTIESAEFSTSGKNGTTTESLPVGEYTFRAERSGWPSFTKKIEVSSVEPTVVSHSFDHPKIKVICPKQDVEISIANSNDAIVWQDRISRSPVIIDNLIPGAHRITAKYRDYDTKVKSVFLKANTSETEVTFDWEVGTVKFSSNFSDARVYDSNETLLGTVSQLGKYEISEGRHRFTAKHDTLGSMAKEIFVKGDSLTSLDFEFAKPAPAPVKTPPEYNPGYIVDGIFKTSDGVEIKTQWVKKSAPNKGEKLVLHYPNGGKAVSVYPSEIGSITLPYPGAILERVAQTPFTGGYHYWQKVFILAPVPKP